MNWWALLAVAPVGAAASFMFFSLKALRRPQRLPERLEIELASQRAVRQIHEVTAVTLRQMFDAARTFHKNGGG
jgi:hypothetical protein